MTEARTLQPVAPCTNLQQRQPRRVRLSAAHRRSIFRCERRFQPVDAGDSKEEDEDPDVEENRPCTAGQLLVDRGRPRPSGLGQACDQQLFGGGLRCGEIVEVFGPAGIGKTQLALTVAAQFASTGSRVIYATSKDSPLELAQRLHTILAARAPSEAHTLEAALGFVQLPHVAEFSHLTHLLAAQQIGEGEEGGLLVVDVASALLAPFVCAVGMGHRWRLAWAWRALCAFACDTNFCVLLCSHTARGKLALGQVWAAAACTRVELSHEEADEYQLGTQFLSATLQKSPRLPVGCRAALVLDGTGVHEDEQYEQ